MVFRKTSFFSWHCLEEERCLCWALFASLFYIFLLYWKLSINSNNYKYIGLLLWLLLSSTMLVSSLESVVKRGEKGEIPIPVNLQSSSQDEYSWGEDPWIELQIKYPEAAVPVAKNDCSGLSNELPMPGLMLYITLSQNTPWNPPNSQAYPCLNKQGIRKSILPSRYKQDLALV